MLPVDPKQLCEAGKSASKFMDQKLTCPCCSSETCADPQLEHRVNPPPLIPAEMYKMLVKTCGISSATPRFHESVRNSSVCVWRRDVWLKRGSFPGSSASQNCCRMLTDLRAGWSGQQWPKGSCESAPSRNISAFCVFNVRCTPRLHTEAYYNILSATTFVLEQRGMSSE